MPAVGVTEDPGHPAYYPDPEADKYRTGDTSSWAEDPHPGPYATPGSVPPAMPGNLVTEDVQHPAFVLKQAALHRVAQQRARICVRIASLLLPPSASEAAIEKRADSLMDFHTADLRNMLAGLIQAKKAEDDSEEEDVEDDEDEEIEEEEEEEEMTAKKKAALRRLALLRKAKKAEDDSEEEEEDKEEDEMTAKKKAALRRLALLRKAKKAEDDSEEEEIEEDDDEEEEEMTAKKKAALRRLALLRKAKKAEDDSEDVEAEDEEEKSAKKKAKKAALRRKAEEMMMEDDEDILANVKRDCSPSSNKPYGDRDSTSKAYRELYDECYADFKTASPKLSKKAEDDSEDVEAEDEDKEAKKAASLLFKHLKRLAAEEEKEEEDKEAKKKAALRRKAEEDAEIEEETTAKKKAALRHKAKLAILKAASRKKKAAEQLRERKASLAYLKKVLKTAAGRKRASDFFGMDTDEIKACMCAEEEDLKACEMEAEDLDGDGVDQDRNDYSTSAYPQKNVGIAASEEDITADLDMMADEDPTAFMDEDEEILLIDDDDDDIMVEEIEDEDPTDFDFEDPTDFEVEDDLDIMAGDTEVEAEDDDSELMAMLRSMAASDEGEESEEEETAAKKASEESDAVEPHFPTPWSGEGGNVNPPKSPVTPQVAQSLKQASVDPMGMMDAADEELAMLFGGAAPKAKKAGLRPQPKTASAAKSPKALGQVTRQASGGNPDDISMLSKLWDQMPDVSKV